MKHNTLGLLDSEVKILYTALKYYVEENVGTKKELELLEVLKHWI